LTALGIGPKQVVHASTNLGLTRASSAEELRQTASHLRHELKKLEEETLEDFLAKNNEAHPVAPALTLDGQLIPVSDEDLRQIFRDNDGWERFRAAYPESSGNVGFSRVGFNAAMTQALVYAGMQVDWLMGHGAYALFAKDGTTWKEVKSTMAWIS
jgi:hypothetical protein